jgi:hypothetical protein
MNDGADLLQDAAAQDGPHRGAVARSIPCTLGQAVLACVLLADRYVGRFVQAVDADGRSVQGSVG